MTDLEPRIKNGARDLDERSEPSPANLQRATTRQPAQPGAIRPALLINATPSIAPTKLSPVKDQPDTSGTPCAQTGCPGTTVDGYCDICGSPAPPTIEQAAPTKPAAAPPTNPAQPSATQTTVSTKQPSPAGPVAAPSQPSLSSAQLAVPSSPGSANAEPTATPAKRRRILPIVLFSVAATLVAVVAVAAIFLNQIERSMTENLDREDLMPSNPSAAPPPPTKEQSAADALNFVVLGYDSRDSSVDRSGSLMILHLNAKRDQAYLISFPRDAWVAVPGHGSDRVNAAYGFGGPKLAVSTLENLTDTRMDHAILVDFQGFARLTDEVGGVTVYNKTAFFAHGFHYPKGKITVSGERAIYFVGERRALPRGDFDRAANERNLVMAIIAKTLSAKIITDPKKIFSVVHGAAEHLTVDKGLTNSRIRNTVLSLRLTNKDVHLIQAPVSGKATKKGQRVDVVDKAKLAELRTALRRDTVHEYLAKYPQG